MLEAAFLVGAAMWGGLALLGLAGYSRLRDLPDSAGPKDGHADAGGIAGPTPASIPGSIPRSIPRCSIAVSIVVPVRDGGPRLRETIERLLAQRGIAAELLVVDDRSTDTTPAVLAGLACEHPSLRVLRVDELPAGWLGKCYACHLAASQARGDWLLFTDADAWCREDVVARAVACAEADAVDHLCLLPGLGEATWPGRGAILLATMGMLGMAWFVNRDARIGYTGVGAFNLIRRDRYDRIGGHERLKLEVIDDFAIGWLVRRSGGRSRLYGGFDDVEVRWAHSAASFVRVLEKNLFAKQGFAAWRTLLHIGVGSVLQVLPFLGMWSGGWAGWTCVVGWGSVAVPASAMARRHGWSPVAGPIALVSSPVILWSMWWSMRTARRRGGVCWRDTFYPLDQLRGR